MNEQQLRELASKNVPELDTNRTSKAIHLVMIDHLTLLPSGNVQVESENEVGHFYQVNPERMTCNCKDFERRKMTCKHLAAYLIWKSVPRQAEPKRILTRAERMTNFENYLKSLNLKAEA